MGRGLAVARALFAVEAIKLRRTAAPWLAVAGPLLTVLLVLAAMFSSRVGRFGDPEAAWQRLMQPGWSLFLGLCVPVLASFEAACLLHMEHEGRQWKQVFSYPIPRWGVYAAKMAVCGLLMGGGIAVGAIGLTGGVLLYGAVYGMGLAGAAPWLAIGGMAVKAWLACWMVVAAQCWVSARLRGFMPGVGIGMAALVIGFAMLRPWGGLMMSYYPWTMPMRTLTGGDLRYPHESMVSVLLGALGGLVVGAWACWRLARREEG